MQLFDGDYRDHIAYSDEKANKVVLAELEHSRTTLWCLKPGQHIHPHVHAGDHVWVILEGKGHYLGTDIEKEIAPGTILAVPAGEAHGVRNDGSEGLVFISISAG
ncbi:MAG: cupin domain-containing protein [Geothermobacteraceae bacterium]